MFPIDTFKKTLLKLVDILRGRAIRFHITGGVTSASYGEPRMTQDIDLVIDPNQTKAVIDSLVQNFSHSDFLFDENTVRTAVESGGMFQLLDKLESLKLDVYARELIPGELDRSVQSEILDGELLPIVSLVDAAGSKLVRISKGSHKSRRDLRAIYRNADPNQQTDIKSTARSLRMEKLLDEVLAESDELE